MVLDLALPKKPGLEDPTNTVVAPSFPEQMPRIVLDRQNKMRHAQTRVVHVHALLTRGSSRLEGWATERKRRRGIPGAGNVSAEFISWGHNFSILKVIMGYSWR
jgi:hypothetical protein